MKTNSKGKVVLQHGDYRVGNFVFHKEPSHIKVTPISGIVSWRVAVETAIGWMLTEALKEKHDNWLHMYASSTFSQLCIVPDQQFFKKHAELVNAQAELHPEYYGKERPTDDKGADDKILQEEKELAEDMERIPKRE